jgi:acetyl esterase/lipase
MQSFRSRIVNLLIRNRHLLQGKWRRDAFTPESSIPAFRAQCEKSARRMSRLPAGVRVEGCRVAGLQAEWLVPAGAPVDKAILYVHGGGYVSGSCADHRGFVATFAKNLGFAALTFEYRLAPEHPYPAALDDALAVYREMLTRYRPSDLLIAGESAGGGLALALLLAVKKANLPQPSAAIAITPWVDLTCSSPGYRTRNRRSAAPYNSWTVFAQHYAGEADRRDPFISPLYGDLNGLPPLLINAGEDDELFDEAENFARRALSAGVQVTFRAGKGMIHCYPLLSPLFPEAVAAMNEIAAFAKEKLGAAGSGAFRGLRAC